MALRMRGLTLQDSHRHRAGHLRALAAANMGKSLSRTGWFHDVDCGTELEVADLYPSSSEEQLMRLIFLAIIIAGHTAFAGASAQPSSNAGLASGPSQTRPAGGQAPKTTVQTPSTTAAAVKAFQERLNDWVAFHNKVEATVPQLTETSDPAKISARERALGEALIKARGKAVSGEYVIKEIQPVIRQIVKADLAKRTSAERKALIVELPKGVQVTVNTIYPTTMPLATMPPRLLKALADLPPELEYRIVYRDLILRDVEGNYVVDVMPDVFPIPY
jgi:hypothetical protein